MNGDAATSNPSKMECEAAAYRAARVHEWLEPILRGGLVAQRAYAFKGRKKSSEDIREKILGRLNHEDLTRRKLDYSPSQVTDASGFRIVRLFNAEVPEALDQLLSLLETALPPGPQKGRLKNGGIREIEFHTSRRLDDPLSIYKEINRVVAQHKLQLKPPAHEDGRGSGSSYSSVHILLECEVGEELSCFSEIQLRSVFEEAWGEISHRLKYAPAKASRASGAASPSRDEPLADFWLHLDALKSLTDGCAQYADLINRQIKSLTTVPPVRTPSPLDPAERSAAQFLNFGEGLRRVVENAYRLRSKAVAAADTGERAAAFRSAADEFQAGIDSFPERHVAEEQRLFDVLREELAFCYIFTENEELQSRAEKIYRELLVTNPGRVSILLRLGQLRRDAADYIEAKKLMEAALGAAERNPDPDPDIQRQANWLVRRDLAYIDWRLADLEPTGLDALPLIEEAIALSEEALPYARTDAQRLNTQQNLLYYLTEFWTKLAPDLQQRRGAKGIPLLEAIRPKVDLEQWRTEALDTVMRAEVAFGDQSRGMMVAKVVAQRLNARIAALRKERNCSHALAFDTLARDEQDMYLFAQDILAGRQETKE